MPRRCRVGFSLTIERRSGNREEPSKNVLCEIQRNHLDQALFRQLALDTNPPIVSPETDSAANPEPNSHRSGSCEQCARRNRPPTPVLCTKQDVQAPARHVAFRLCDWLLCDCCFATSSQDYSKQGLCVCKDLLDLTIDWRSFCSIHAVLEGGSLRKRARLTSDRGASMGCPIALLFAKALSV